MKSAFRKSLRFLPVAIIIFIAVTGTAIAQELPAGSEPGAASKRFQQDIDKRREEVTEKPLKAPDITVEKKEEKPSPEGAVSFLLKEIKIEGSTLFETGEFRKTYESYIGKEVTFKELDAAVNNIKAMYKAKGYLTTIVYVPEQEIKDGTVIIKVAEGKMGALKVEGTKWFSSGLIKKYIHIKKNEPLNILELERDILRINKNPDVEVKAVLSPGAEPETSDVTLTVKDKFPYHAGGGADNQGTRLAGRENGIVTFRSSNMTGNNDSFFTSYLYAKHANAQSISYTLPIDTYGTKMGISYTHYNMRIGKEFMDLRITGDTKTLGGYISKELYLSSDAEGYLTAGLDAKSTKKHLDGITTADDEMRIPYFGFDFTNNDLWGTTVISPRFDFGTGHFLGASKKNHPTASRADTGGFYFKYSQGVTRLQRMFLESYSIIHFQGQVATHTLSPTEQIQLGGLYSIRGYPEGDFLADTGAFLNFDWIFPMYPIPKYIKLPYSDIPLRQQIQPVLFVDVGGGRINKSQSFEMRDKFLAGFGGGLRIRLYKNVFCRFEWAKDIGSDPTPNSAPSTFHFTIQTEI